MKYTVLQPNITRNAASQGLKVIYSALTFSVLVISVVVMLRKRNLRSVALRVSAPAATLKLAREIRYTDWTAFALLGPALAICALSGFVRPVQVPNNPSTAPTIITQKRDNNTYDPDDPKSIRASFSLDSIPLNYWRQYEMTGSSIYSKQTPSYEKISNGFLFSYLFDGYRIATITVGDRSETFVFERRQIHCFDIKIIKNPVNKWERDYSTGYCKTTSDVNYPGSIRVWRRDDGSFIDADKNVVVSPDYR